MNKLCLGSCLFNMLCSISNDWDSTCSFLFPTAEIQHALFYFQRQRFNVFFSISTAEMQHAVLFPTAKIQCPLFYFLQLRDFQCAHGFCTCFTLSEKVNIKPTILLASSIAIYFKLWHHERPGWFLKIHVIRKIKRHDHQDGRQASKHCTSKALKCLLITFPATLNSIEQTIYHTALKSCSGDEVTR